VSGRQQQPISGGLADEWKGCCLDFANTLAWRGAAAPSTAEKRSPTSADLTAVGLAQSAGSPDRTVEGGPGSRRMAIRLCDKGRLVRPASRCGKKQCYRICGPPLRGCSGSDKASRRR